MKILHLVRHAKSSWGHPELTDFQRPLNHRGEKSVEIMGEALAAESVSPQLIVSSPAVRAASTAKSLAAHLSMDDQRIDFRKKIYEASFSTLLGIIRGLDDSFSEVMLVGHNPGFTDLANALGDNPISNLPTCAVYSISFNTDFWKEIGTLTGKCIRFDKPKSHKQH